MGIQVGIVAANNLKLIMKINLKSIYGEYFNFFKK